MIKGLSCLLDNNTHSVKVTVSEAAEKGCVSFFESAGFQQVGTISNRYRKGLDEFIYLCDRNNILKLIKKRECR